MSGDVADPVTLPDGRRLDTYLGGAEDGPVGTILYHHGSPSSGMLPPGMEAAAAGLGLKLVGFSRAGYGSSSRRPGRSVADIVTDAVDLLDALGIGRLACWAGLAADRMPSPAPRWRQIGSRRPHP